MSDQIKTTTHDLGRQVDRASLAKCADLL